MRKILNYTLHDITIITESGTIVIPKHGTARCSPLRDLDEWIDLDEIRIPVNKTTFGYVEGLPEPKDDTIIIVSAITANVMREKRNDLYTVDEPVRDGTGKIVGCRALSSVTKYGKQDGSSKSISG